MKSALILRSALVTLVLLPTSCAAGSMAADRMDSRLIGNVPVQSAQWYENVLWLTALALMLIWAWAMKRLWEGDK